MNNKETKDKKNENHDRLFAGITEAEREKAIEMIMSSSCPRKSFFVMVIAAAIICTLGIMSNNAAVIIGAMLVAPMLSPILAISLGVVMADFKLIRRSLRVVVLAVLYSIGFSFLIALLLKKPDGLNSEMMLRAGVSLEAIIIALVAGVAASLSIIKEELQQFLTGTMIAVALIPPVSMSAVALRMGQIDVFYGALMLFFFNLLSIILSSLLVFSLSRFYVSRYKAQEELKEEEQFLGSKEEE